jgi:hypothetical protein
MAEWSNNETNYVVNELLRFALTQEDDFQKYKSSSAGNVSRPAGNAKASPVRSASDATPKSELPPVHA